MAQIREEIRFGGNNEDLVWKSPIRDFNTGSVVIVNESQGAVFYMNGEASDELGAGLHVLETCETPFIKRIIQKIQGTKTPFQAELYYVNKVEIPQLRWGVGEITYREEGFVFPIGARGMYNVRVENARKLIEKVNGTEWGFNRDELEDRFLELVTSAVDNALINAIYDQAGSIIDAPRYRTQIMNAVRPEVEQIFAEYGLKITQFIIERIHVDEENENYRQLLDLQKLQGGGAKARILEAQLKAQEKGIAGQGEAAFRAAQGYTYQQERQFDVLDTAASNDNSMAGGMAGGFMQMGVGLGAMGAVGGMVKDSMSGMTNNFSGMMNATQQPAANQPATAAADTCKNCGAALAPGAKFCLECGTKVEVAQKITCPHCGATVQGGKFCLECGGSLVPTQKVCSNCGHKFESGKFCPECGTKCE